MNPAEKWLAVRTEDHPLESADFEGVIPEGQYGAGTVMIWDKGLYEPEDGVPLDEQLARGKIIVVLHGKNLRGGLTLVQTGKRSAVSSQGKRWLLIKQRDEDADPSWNIESPEWDRSVLTGRMLQEIEGGLFGLIDIDRRRPHPSPPGGSPQVASSPSPRPKKWLNKRSISSRICMRSRVGSIARMP